MNKDDLLKKVQVFQICECDAVAAYTIDEAISWYKEQTGLADEELYNPDDVEVLSHDYKVYNAEKTDEMISIREIIDAHWNGTPFIACSTEW